MTSPRARLAVLASVAAIAMAACVSAGASPSAPVSSATAGPLDVLTSYLTALKAGDCATAHQYVTSTFRISNGELCGSVAVSAFTPPGEPATPADGEMIFSTELTTGGDGVSIRAGQMTWFYSLAKQPDGAWRLIGGGSGP